MRMLERNHQRMPSSPTHITPARTSPTSKAAEVAFGQPVSLGCLRFQQAWFYAHKRTRLLTELVSSPPLVTAGADHGSSECGRRSCRKPGYLACRAESIAAQRTVTP